MQRVYGARDSVEAEFVKALLEAEEIQAIVQGSALEAARGDIPYAPASLPSVWVNDEDVDRASQIVEEFRRGGPAATQPQIPWTCPTCGEKLDGQFTTCWNCSTENPQLRINHTTFTQEKKRGLGRFISLALVRKNPSDYGAIRFR